MQAKWHHQKPTFKLQWKGLAPRTRFRFSSIIIICLEHTIPFQVGRKVLDLKWHIFRILNFPRKAVYAWDISMYSTHQVIVELKKKYSLAYFPVYAFLGLLKCAIVWHIRVESALIPNTLLENSSAKVPKNPQNAVLCTTIFNVNCLLERRGLFF